MQRQKISLRVPKPFSLKATVLSHGWHECAPISWSEGGQCLQVIERVGSQPCRLSVVEARKTKRSVILEATLEASELDQVIIESLRDRISVILNLDRDLVEFHEFCQTHATLRVLPALGAGRLIRCASMTENVIKTICATNVNWTQAVKMINRLSQPGPCIRHFVHQNAWPTPREILRAGESYLQEVCRLGYRTDSILALCRNIIAGVQDPEQLFAQAATCNVNSTSLMASLTSIRGIGPASAPFLLSLLGHFDHLSIDSATIAHVARIHMNGEKPTPKQVEEIYAPFGRWKNLVYWFENWLTWDTAKRMMVDAGISVDRF